MLILPLFDACIHLSVIVLALVLPDGAALPVDVELVGHLVHYQHASTTS
ncbi:hypothetical protein KL86CIT2_90004 [uncultured Citrobacter sp.]|uniref:Uncharacterized protein n=1 Tax=uncultured Citrobacter sp. TaxID=200446 RepID=A0A212IT57_9ENTR|nr:hypothetical protein KL86CIT2_90004 [uncultured Citrobacter sp.]